MDLDYWDFKSSAHHLRQGHLRRFGVGVLAIALVSLLAGLNVQAESTLTSTGRILIDDESPVAGLALDGQSQPLSSVEDVQENRIEFRTESSQESTGVDTLRGSVLSQISSASMAKASQPQQSQDHPTAIPDKPQATTPQQQSVSKNALKRLKQSVKPPATPVSSMVVIPLIVDGNQRAFSDSAIILAETFADRLEVSVPGAQIIHPTDLWENIQSQNLSHLYERLVNQMHQSGRPSSSQTKFLLGQLYPGIAIERVFWIEANLDMGQLHAPANLWERAKQWASDDIPKEGNYFLSGRVQAYDLSNPAMPKLWATTRTKSIKSGRLGPVALSVYERPGTQHEIAKTARIMSRDMQLLMPGKVSWKTQPNVLTRVQGTLATGQATSLLKSP